jgi:hypothetical protein
MEITLIARATGATPSLNVTHDSVV